MGSAPALSSGANPSLRSDRVPLLFSVSARPWASSSRAQLFTYHTGQQGRGTPPAWSPITPLKEPNTKPLWTLSHFQKLSH